MTELDDASYDFFMEKVGEAERDPKLARHKNRYGRLMLRRELLVLYEIFSLSNHFDIRPGTRKFDRLYSTVKGRYPTDIEIAKAAIGGTKVVFPRQIDAMSMYNDSPD